MPSDADREATPNPKAFVLMPFAESFTSIYTDFLEPALESCGFEVARADNAINAQNVLKDIVQGISESHLVIADLTESNINVYYELGVAHALNKPVILITQDVDDMPFDIRSYRVILYTTHFTEIAQARIKIKDIASRFISGSVQFGSPISDFLNHEIELFSESQSENEEIVEYGFLDNLAHTEEGFDTITQQLEGIADETSSIGEKIQAGTRQLNGSRSTHQRRNIVRNIARAIDGYAAFLNTKNDIYREQLETIVSPLESVVKYARYQVDSPGQDGGPDADKDQVVEFLKSIIDLETSIDGALDGIGQFRQILQEMPNIERRFNQARSSCILEIERLADNSAYHKTIIGRIAQIIEQDNVS